MASYSSSKEVDVVFTEEEKEVLEKARDILKSVGKDLWNDDFDEESFFFSELGNGIENALKGNYWLP